MTADRPRRLLHAFSTFKLGGPQARFVQLANAFGPDFHHTIVAMDNCFEAGERLDPCVAWESLRLDVVKGGAMANRGTFRRVLKTLAPDLLLSYNWGSMEWAAANLPRLFPHVHVEDGFGPEEANTQLARRVWMRRLLLGLNHVPVIVASRNLEGIATDIWKLSASRVHHIPNGVPAPAERHDQTLTHRSDGCIRIGTVAGLRPEKNIGRLVRAFAAVHADHPMLRLILVGDGPLRTDLETMAANLGVGDVVEFAGYLKDPAPRLQEFDLFALSSDTEQLPMALLEAMAQGIPAIATRVGDVGSVLADVEPGTLCPPDDAAFEKLLRQVIGSRSQWPVWGERARHKVATDFSQQNMLARWREAYAGGLC